MTGPEASAPPWIRIVRVAEDWVDWATDAPRVTCDDAVAAFLRPRLRAEDVEVILVLAVDADNRVMAVHEVARGGGGQASVGAREVYRAALVVGARAVIVAHNHPSGSPRPSPEDDAMTARLRDAGETVGVPLLDHVIVAADGRHYSYMTTGRLGEGGS